MRPLTPPDRMCMVAWRGWSGIVLNEVAEPNPPYARPVRTAVAQAPGVNPKWPAKARVM
jgi:hypothetical protein